MAQSTVSLGLTSHAIPRAPCAVTCGFESLGDDATLLLAGFLRARDLVNLQRCSRRLNLVSRHRDLWGRLVAIDFEVSAGSQRGGLRTFPAAPAREGALGAALVEHPYLTYKRYYLTHRAKLEQHARRDEERILAQKLVDNKTRLRYALDCVEYPLGLGSHGAAVFSFLLLLLYKLNRGFDISYWAVFAPLLVPPSAYIISFLTGLMTRLADRSLSDRWPVCSGQDDASTHTCYDASVSLFGALAVRNKIKFCLRGTWVICMALLVVILAPLLLCFKLQGGILADSTTWAVAFIPIWLIFGCWCLFPLAGKRLAGGYGNALAMLALSLVSFYIPAIIIAAEVVARLDGVHYISVALIFVPLWIIDSLLLLGCGTLFVMSCCDNDVEDRPKEFAAGCALVAVLAIALPAQILASVSDSRINSVTPSYLLGPMLAVAAIATLLNCACSVLICWQARRRSDDFENAYTFGVVDRICCCGGLRQCCRRREASTDAIIVVLHAPGIGPVDM